MLLRDVLETTNEFVSANDYAVDALERMRSNGNRWSFVVDRDEVIGLVFTQTLESHPTSVLRTTDVKEHINSELPDIQDADLDLLLRSSQKQDSVLSLLNQMRSAGSTEREEELVLTTRRRAG
jgi:hypothetical protein